MKEPDSQKIFVPVDLYDWMKRIESKLELSHNNPHRSSNTPPEGTVGDFVAEEKALKMLRKGKTWLYYQRKKGRIRSYKLGAKTFYRMSELEKLIEDGIQD